MKEHIDFICKTAFLEIRGISTICHYLTDDAPKLLLFLSYSYALTIATLSWLVSLSPWSTNLRKSKTVQPVLWFVHFHMFTLLQYSDLFTGCLSKPEFPIRPCRCFNATISTPAYLSDLLHLYSLSWSLRSSADIRVLKIPFYKSKAKCDRAFSYFGTSLWNSMPLHIRNATTINTFKCALKTYLLHLQECH